MSLWSPFLYPHRTTHHSNTCIRQRWQPKLDSLIIQQYPATDLEHWNRVLMTTMRIGLMNKHPLAMVIKHWHSFFFFFFLCVVMAMILRWLLGSHTKQGCCWVLVNVGLSPPMDILPIKLIIKLEFPISKRTVNNDFWATFDVLRNQHEYCTSHDWEFPPQTHMPSCRNERKITPISKDQHEVEPFGLMLITVFHDAV